MSEIYLETYRAPELQSVLLDKIVQHGTEALHWPDTAEPLGLALRNAKSDQVLGG